MKERLEKFMKENGIKWEEVADYNTEIDTEGDLLEEELEEAKRWREEVYQDYLKRGHTYITEQLFEGADGIDDPYVEHVLKCMHEWVLKCREWKEE